MTKTPLSGLTLVLDNLRSCHNVGSIIRTANGFGCRRFAFIGTTPYPRLAADKRLPHAIDRQTGRIKKTALGAEEEIEGRHFATAADFLATASGQLICLEQTPDATPLDAWRPARGDYLVFGHELDGVSAPPAPSGRLLVNSDGWQQGLLQRGRGGGYRALPLQFVPLNAKRL